jgi:hypothetical protein
MPLPTIQLREFCRLFNWPDRPVRFILEQGYVPKGVEESPSTGNRREFGPRQAFWLAIATHLRLSGMRTKSAAEVAELTVDGVRSLAHNLGWDPSFEPAAGFFQTDFKHFLDVGDLRYIRIATDSHPSKRVLFEFPWRLIKKSGEVRDVNPFVIIRLDVSKVASALGTVPGWNRTKT